MEKQLVKGESACYYGHNEEMDTERGIAHKKAEYPRRFRKTMSISMLAHFFDIRKDSKDVL